MQIFKQEFFHFINMSVTFLGKSLYMNITLPFYTNIMAKVSAETKVKAVTLNRTITRQERHASENFQKSPKRRLLLLKVFQVQRQPGNKCQITDERMIARLFVANAKLTARQVGSKYSLDTFSSCSRVLQLEWSYSRKNNLAKNIAIED